LIDNASILFPARNQVNGKRLNAKENRPGPSDNASANPAIAAGYPARRQTTP
jgi:hypothetical protein